uniref:Dynein heavy chain C-terminal domain-containing protein n=1 Tax=Varanus komodoensis TaxID=61221 RepID=A0A8D2ITF0_VARKO
SCCNFKNRHISMHNKHPSFSHRKGDPKLYVCPIYKKPRRTDLTYITAIYLRTTVSPDHWILRGVALLCDIK